MLNETDENYLMSWLLMKEVSKSANKANLVHMYKSTACLCLSLNNSYQWLMNLTEGILDAVCRCHRIQFIHQWIDEGKKLTESCRDLPQDEEKSLPTVCWYLYHVDQFIRKGDLSCNWSLILMNYISPKQKSQCKEEYLIDY